MRFGSSISDLGMVGGKIEKLLSQVRLPMDANAFLPLILIWKPYDSQVGKAMVGGKDIFLAKVSCRGDWCYGYADGSFPSACQLRVPLDRQSIVVSGDTTSPSPLISYAREPALKSCNRLKPALVKWKCREPALEVATGSTSKDLKVRCLARAEKRRKAGSNFAAGLSDLGGVLIPSRVICREDLWGLSVKG
ncbi:hypothetical protein SLEP1_g34844 [Rubroshorea leprosula]|uniref:Uncharacterized protein n=1 Tax=Rubroshorea leprosula TaxID=152421 RepID=A0AAV5KLB8_9ROSI|nr:hypothetical protein SLEP1_g34844 [Rubroshorea leprosula]